MIIICHDNTCSVDYSQRVGLWSMRVEVIPGSAMILIYNTPRQRWSIIVLQR